MENDINIQVVNTCKFKTICIAILLRQNLTKDTVTLNSVLSKILTLGTQKYKTIRDINIKTEQMYGTTIYSDVLKKGDNQIIEILIEFLNDKVCLEEIFLFLKEILLNPLIENNGFNKDFTQKAKNIVKEAILTRQNDKKDFAKDRCIEIMCKNEGFGILGDGYLEDLENDKINEKNLYNHYQNILKTAPIDIFVIGDVKEETIKDLTKKHLTITDRQYKPIKTDFVFKDQTKPNTVVENFDITQGKLCMAYRTNIKADTPDFIPLLVANEILGGGSGSMLFNNVREKESLCYYINSFIFIFKGIVFIQSGVDFKSYEKAIKKISENVEMIKNGNFDENMLQIAKTSLCKKYNSILDYNTSLIDYHYTNYLLGINMDIPYIIKNINKVTKNDVTNSFKNIWLDTCYFMKGDEIDR